MSDPVRPRRRRTNALSPRAPETPNPLVRILDTPHLAQAVPRLQSEVLLRVIHHYGLEACSDLIALATPAQLSAVFDLDLWSGRPGQDEQFDPDRFAVWLEVLAESGVEFAAGRLAAIDAALVIAALAKDMRVVDAAAGLVHNSDRDIGGYRLVARRGELSETLVGVLVALGSDHPEYFHRVMRGCRRLSNSTPEPDGFHDLLGDPEQALFDLAFDRELRREKQGFVTPAQARAFLKESRQPHVDHARTNPAMPGSPVATAYLRAIDWNKEPPPAATDDSTAAVAGVIDVLDMLTEAGVLPSRPQALLTGQTEEAPRLAHLRRQLDFVADHNQAAFAVRSQELAFLANAILAGSSVQDRPFTVQEASDGALAVCNLGVQNWPVTPPDDFLVEHDLIGVFQAGWKRLYDEVCMFAAARLIAVLENLQCHDRQIQTDLDQLIAAQTRHWRAGEPWGARHSLDVIAMLDMPSWAAVVGLIAEFPVMHAVISSSRLSRPRSIDAGSFDFISENSQIAMVREFMASLPEALGERIEGR